MMTPTWGFMCLAPCLATEYEFKYLSPLLELCLDPKRTWDKFNISWSRCNIERQKWRAQSWSFCIHVLNNFREEFAVVKLGTRCSVHLDLRCSPGKLTAWPRFIYLFSLGCGTLLILDQNESGLRLLRR